MKIVVGGEVIDADHTPVMLSLTPADRKQIRKIPEDLESLHFSCPDDYSAKEMDQFFNAMKRQLEEGENSGPDAQTITPAGKPLRGPVARELQGQDADKVVLEIEGLLAERYRINAVAHRIHLLNRKWWHDEDGIALHRNRGEMICLIHSEISEAMEGERKNLMDDKLPHRKMAEVELADALIRLFDFASGCGFTPLPPLPRNPVPFISRNKGQDLCYIHHLVSDLYVNTGLSSIPEPIENKITEVVSSIYLYAKHYGYDLDGAIVDKLRYNVTRHDHTYEARKSNHGKKF